MTWQTIDSCEVPDANGGEHVGTWPSAEAVPKFTDKYFSRTRAVIRQFGEREATYAVFMRRPVLAALRAALSWLRHVTQQRGISCGIEERYQEGEWVGAGEPLVYITGPFSELVELETLLLQKTGAACVAAYQSFLMCQTLPKTAFIAMDARHCTGPEMAALMAYAAAVGSQQARKKNGAIGFIGGSTDAGAHFFGTKRGIGTMPHGLIGYAGSTLRAAQMFHQTFPEEPLTVLVDYFGREISDAVEVCRSFPHLANNGDLAIRLDTHGGRFIEGMDTPTSYGVLNRNAPNAIRGYRTEADLKHLIGPGVSAAALWRLREALNQEGYPKVRIIASSGFTTEKCAMMALAHAPIDVVGTGSYLPDAWSETYATVDIIAYDGRPRVKLGREFLLKEPVKGVNAIDDRDPNTSPRPA